MNAKNIKMMAVVAAIIVICLLFSWVNYGNGAGDGQEDSFEGTWYPVYSYESGTDFVVDVPEYLEATVSEGTVSLTYQGSTIEFMLISDVEAVSPTYGVEYQLYLEDGILYMFSIGAGDGDHGLAYIAMSRDSSATLPSDRVDLTGTASELTFRMCNGAEFRPTEYPASITVDSNSFHVAEGTILMDGLTIDYSGFVKSDGSRSIITGYYSDTDGGVGKIDVLVEDGQVAVAMDRTYAVVSQPEGLDTDLGDGMLTIETGSGSYTMDVDVSGGLVNVSGDAGSTYIFIPGTVLWTMGDDYVLMKGGSILSYDGSEYSLVVNRFVA